MAWHVAALMSAVVPTAALACRCAPMLPTQAYRLADSIVLAEVKGVDTKGYQRSYRVVVRTA